MTVSATDVYTEFSGFSSLRAEAREGGDEARLKVAEQVEGVFMSMMLKSMREAGQAFGDTLGGIHQGMYDSQLAVDLTKGGKLGFAKTMFASEPVAASVSAQAVAYPVPARSMTLPARDWVAVRAIIENEQTPSQSAVPQPEVHGSPAAVESTEHSAHWQSPRDFARQLWPAATRAAEQLGTSPQAVLAVAALETGWGKHMPRNADGSASNNLFGIKSHGWNGSVTHSSTLEFENGAFTRRIEPFRAYASPQEAVADFANFVASQPRYRDALQSDGDAVKFVRALHAAGYATDPRYGEKLEALVKSPVLQHAAISDTNSST